MIIARSVAVRRRTSTRWVVGFGSTFLSVFLGTLAAYGFSRFRVPGRDDWMFFILSTR